MTHRNSLHRFALGRCDFAKIDGASKCRTQTDFTVDMPRRSYYSGELH